MGDFEDIQDRVISDARLLEILRERDDKIYNLERRLYKAEAKLGQFVGLWRAVSSIE